MREKYGQVIIPEALSERAAVRKAIALNVAGFGLVPVVRALKAAQEWRAACRAIQPGLTYNRPIPKHEVKKL